MKVIWIMDKELDAASDKAYVSTLAENLNPFGAEVRVVSRYRQTREQFGDTKINYVWTPQLPGIRRMWYFLVAAMSVLRILRTSDCDLVVIDRPPLVLACFPLILVSRFKKTFKLVLDVRSLPNDNHNTILDRIKWGSFELGLWLASRLYDGCMVITPAMQKYIVEHSKFDTDQIGMWSSAFDGDLFDPSCTPVAPEIGKAQSINFVYHGAVAPNRMLHETINALKLCKENVHLYVLGNGPSLSELENLSTALGVGDKVSFLPPVAYKAVPPYLKAADIGIVPIPNTLWFHVSMPIKLLEYMAMGLPVIAPSIEPVRNVVRDAEVDIEEFEIVDSRRQPEFLAKAIDAAAQRWGKNTFSNKNRACVQTCHTWQSQAQNIFNYLSKL